MLTITQASKSASPSLDPLSVSIDQYWTILRREENVVLSYPQNREYVRIDFDGLLVYS